MGECGPGENGTMDTLIFIIRTGLILTGVAVWVFVLAIMGGFMAHLVRTWKGWETVSNWWFMATGGK